jgi:Uma2 family endonuclease
MRGFHRRPDGPIDPYTAYEPDASVRLGMPGPPDAMKITDPVSVVEVVSPSSVHSDASAKLIGYFKLDSVQHYLVIDPDSRTVTHHSRTADGTISASTLNRASSVSIRPGSRSPSRRCLPEGEKRITIRAHITPCE